MNLSVENLDCIVGLNWGTISGRLTTVKGGKKRINM
jgi:hypothetical protein